MSNDFYQTLWDFWCCWVVWRVCNSLETLFICSTMMIMMMMMMISSLYPHMFNNYGCEYQYVSELRITTDWSIRYPRKMPIKNGVSNQRPLTHFHIFHGLLFVCHFVFAWFQYCQASQPLFIKNGTNWFQNNLTRLVVTASLLAYT